MMKKPALWIRPEPRPEDDTLKDALFKQGISVAVANEEETVSGFYRRQDVSALLADASLIDVACRFRDNSEEAAKRHLPLVVLSRESDLQTRLNALRQGVDAFFPPPLDTEKVAEKLAKLLGVRPDVPPYRVVVVDDDADQAEYAASILLKVGFQVRTVTASLKTLDVLRSFKPELILMDVYMPEASGVELTTIIREQQDLMDIPIVYLSGEQDPDKQLDALSVGAEDFLTKPIRPKHLIATVRNRIDRARQLREKISDSRRQEGDPALVRKHILEQMERLQDTSIDTADRTTGLLYVELDNPLLLLERINLDGIDQVMSGIMKLSRETTQSADRLSRFGDFCLVFIVQRKQEQELLELAQRIKAAVDPHQFRVEKALVNTTVSIGVRLLDDPNPNVPELISDAVKACHQAREQSDGGIKISRSAKPKTAAQVKGGIEDDRILALVDDPNNLDLLYQPILPLQQDQSGLYQCLMQLHTPDGNILQAHEFLPVVEQTGKILKLDRWVIIKTLVEVHKLLMNNPRAQPPRLMISQSATAIRDLQRISWIEESLTKTGIKGQALVLDFPFPEITANRQQARDYLSELRQLGVGLSLNCTRDLDALSQDLNLLPVHYLKITEKQIRNYPDTWNQLVKAAHKLGKRVIVSRIEHPELLGKLWSSDVDYIQGAFVQPPGKDLNYDFSGNILM